MTQDQLFDIIQDHFDYLDQIVSRREEQGLTRGPVVMGFPELDRDLYFVHDVLGITNNAGVGAWIHYHIDDEGWIDDAARAYRAIGHDAAAQGLLEAREHYRGNPEDDEWDRPFHRHIICKEDAISKSLFSHLAKQGFAFHTPADIAEST